MQQWRPGTVKSKKKKKKKKNVIYKKKKNKNPIRCHLTKYPCGSAGKEVAGNAGDLGSIPGLGRSLGEGNGYPLQYSGLENSMDCIVRGVAKSLTRLSEFHFHFQPSAHMNCWDSESCLTHSGLCLLIQGRLLLPRSQQVPDWDSAWVQQHPISPVFLVSKMIRWWTGQIWGSFLWDCVLPFFFLKIFP